MSVFNSGGRFVLLAPTKISCPPPPELHAVYQQQDHERLFGEMQRVRARVMIREGAIPPAALDADGRHAIPGDDRSWHILRMRGDGTVAGCARILVHPRDVRFEDTRVSACRSGAAWDQSLREAVERELLWARHFNLLPVEPGGWALDEDTRGTGSGIALAVAAFAWAAVLGDCVGFLTATVKNCSAAMLRRLGGKSLQTPGGVTVPGYWDERWETPIEVLRFDTQSLDDRFRQTLDRVRRDLMRAPVIFAAAPLDQKTTMLQAPPFSGKLQTLASQSA